MYVMPKPKKKMQMSIMILSLRCLLFLQLFWKITFYINDCLYAILHRACRSEREVYDENTNFLY